MASQRHTFGGIILAGGRGKRMQLEGKNKVTMPLRNKPMISHIVSFMQSLHLASIIVVVGHAKESVQEALKGEAVLYAVQEEQLGTGDAVKSALTVLPQEITDVLVLYGDDAVLYTEENMQLLRELFATHEKQNAAITFLTIEQDNPVGLGRIVRNREGQVQAIIEEKDATDEQKALQEINPGCFLFSVSFLREYLPRIEKSQASGEYYLTSLIDLGIQNKQSITTVRGGKRKWRGVNTPEELKIAENML